MVGYCIVPIGGEPAESINLALGATCEEWSKRPDKQELEVVRVLLGEVVRRISVAEAEYHARQWQDVRSGK